MLISYISVLNCLKYEDPIHKCLRDEEYDKDKRMETLNHGNKNLKGGRNGNGNRKQRPDNNNTEERSKMKKERKEDKAI